MVFIYIFTYFYTVSGNCGKLSIILRAKGDFFEIISEDSPGEAFKDISPGYC